MNLTNQQRAELKAVAEFEPTGDNFSDRVNQQVANEADLKAVARQAILVLLADLEEAEGAARIAELERVLRGAADQAYIDYITVMRRTECLGVEYKLKSGTFGTAELAANCEAAGKLARHRALHEAANIVAETMRSQS